MISFWKYLSAILASALITTILWKRVPAKTIYNGRVKVKQKGKDNTSDLDVVLTVKDAKQLKKKLRKEKRDGKKK